MYCPVKLSAADQGVNVAGVRTSIEERNQLRTAVQQSSHSEQVGFTVRVLKHEMPSMSMRINSRHT